MTLIEKTLLMELKITDGNLSFKPIRNCGDIGIVSSLNIIGTQDGIYHIEVDITQALQEQDRESISKAFRVVMNIYIPHDNSDSEIHQLRFKEKIVAYAKQHNIDLHEN